MHPTIANLIATDRRRELLASAANNRRVRRPVRSSGAGKAGREETVRGRPQLGFQTWLAAGRL